MVYQSKNYWIVPLFWYYCYSFFEGYQKVWMPLISITYKSDYSSINLSERYILYVVFRHRKSKYWHLLEFTVVLCRNVDKTYVFSLFLWILICSANPDAKMPVGNLMISNSKLRLSAEYFSQNSNWVNIATQPIDVMVVMPHHKVKDTRKTLGWAGLSR